jgi:hypothetical protein
MGGSSNHYGTSRRVPKRRTVRAQRNLGIAEPGRSALAHIGGFAAQQEVVARRREEIDNFAVFAKPSLVLRTSRNDHDVAGAADPLFAAEAELHLSLEHPHDLLVCVTVRLDVDASPDAPPYDHSSVAGENAAADLVADPLLR